MVSKKTVDQCLYMIKIDLGISIPDDDFIMKSNLLFQVFRNKSDKEFESATYKLLECSKELYGKLPTISMYKEKLDGVQIPIEDIASSETLKITNSISSYWSSLETTNKTTIKTVTDLGGLEALKWRLDDDNPNKDDIKWLKKEIRESWLANASMENKDESIFDNCNYLKDLSNNLGQKFSIGR